MELGAKIKEQRLQCGFTQEELADRCDLTKGYISQLENDLTSPSIATLVDILSALGTNLSDFFTAEKEEQVIFTEDDFFEKLTEDEKIVWLVPNSQKNEMEPIIIEIRPNTKLSQDIPHEGEEFGFILEGTVVLHLGNKAYKVKKGESFYYASNKVHYLENATNKVAKLIWVSSPPTF